VATTGFDISSETRVTLPPLVLPTAALTSAATTIPPTAAKGPAVSAVPTTVAPTTVTTAVPRRPVRMLIVGESTAGATGTGIQTWGRQTGRAEVEMIASGGCALQQDGLARLRSGWTEPATEACRNLISDAIAAANRSKPDLVMLFIGSGQLNDWVLPGKTEAEATFIGEPAFDQLYSATAAGLLRRLASLGVPVLFTTTPIPNWDPVVQTGNPIVPGTGPIKMNDAGRARRLNDLTTQAVRGISLAEMVPYAERISAPNGTVDPAIRPDGLHLRPDAVPGIMNKGLEADMRASYQRATGRVKGALRNGPTFWSP
jgi:hypothetical protein